MPNHDLIVVGASAGGVEALITLAGGLPANLPAAVCVVLHMSPQAPSVLPKILSRHGPLPAKHPRDHDPLRPGHIYVAPPDRHLLVTADAVRVVPGPKENRNRPAVDPLFRSAALAFGPRAVGVVLTGALNDGTAGLLAIKRRGGIAVVQDPDEAIVPNMPASALAHVAVDACLPLAEIGAYLARVAHELAPPAEEFPASEELQMETDIAGLDPTAGDRETRPGRVVGLVCPSCKGPLWEIQDDALLRYRCRVGHAFTAQALLADQSEAVEEALWLALNTLEQTAQIQARLAEDAHMQNRPRAAAHFTDEASAISRRAGMLRDFLLRLPGSASDLEEAEERLTRPDGQRDPDAPAAPQPAQPSAK